MGAGITPRCAANAAARARGSADAQIPSRIRRMIHFGTDGWRAVISDTFTYGNLRLVSQAIADAVSSDDWLHRPGGAAAPDPPRRMIVGFDTRFLSDRYAMEVARVLTANGFSVQLTHSDAPTPAVSYAVKHQHAAGGVMIT